MYIEDGKFAIWCDFVERDFLENDFEKLIESGVINGATSNPAIFKNAFLTSKAYAEDKKTLHDKSAKELYEALAIEDIKIAADKLATLYDRSDDGFISIEIDPNLYNNTEGSIKEGRDLYKKIAKNNVMIKIPATTSSYEAMSVLISEGININATLIFSPSQSEKCLDALEKGLKIFREQNPDKKAPQAVISVFVSPFDKELERYMSIKGKLGIYNATKIYHQIEKRGLEGVRTLFASTGVKDDNYPKDYYMKELCFANSVNTAPLDTVEAYVEAGDKSLKEPASLEDIEEFFIQVKKDNVDIDKVYNALLDQGITAFIDAFDEILKDMR